MFTRFFLFIFFCSCSYVFAVEPSKNMQFGRFQLEPTLQVRVEQDDNVLEAPNNELDDLLTEYIPKFNAIYSGVLLDASFEYSFYSGQYSDYSLNDYDDHHLDGSLAYQLSRKNSIELSASYYQEHEDRSVDDLDFIVTGVPDEYERTNVELIYIFGRPNSKGRIELYSRIIDKEYTNNRSSTFEDDRERLLFGGRFQLRLSPRSNAFFELSQEEFDYINDPANLTNVIDTLDSTRNQYFAGFKWRSSAKTEGIIKLGYTDKTFSDNDREDFSAFSWEANILWTLSPLSSIRFNTVREDRESDNGVSGGFIDQTSYLVAWNKSWGNKFRSSLQAELLSIDYIDYIQNREEELTRYALNLDYAVKRWLDLGFSASLQTNDASSDTGNFDYDRNQYTFYIRAGL